MPPRLSLSLDENNLAGSSDQHVKGAIRIISESSIQVLHLRVVFYGHAQVHGAQPGTSLSNGIFDYLEDRQLINTGIRITRRPSLVEDSSYPIAESSKDAMKRPPLPPTRYSNTSSALNNNSTFTTNSNDSGSSSASDDKKKSTKTALDKETERLIRRIALKERPEDAAIHPELADFDYPPARIYDLHSKAHNVRYRLVSPTTSRLLPASFDHPHCPIRYYTIAVLLCRELETGTYYMAYARLPVLYAPRINVLSTTYAGLLRETDRLWLGNDSLLSRLLNSSHHYRHRHKTTALVKNYSNPSFVSAASSTSSLSSISHGVASSFLTHWWHRLTQSHTWIRLDRQGKYTKTLDCTLELPRRAFCRGQPLPFSVNLVNGAGIRIAMVTIEMKLVRRVVMTCSVAETVDSTVEFETTSTFYGDEVDVPDRSPTILTPPSTPPLKPEARQPFFLFTTREMKFDLSGVVTVPPTSPCTIMPELTRNTFEMVYDWVVKVRVLETKQGPRLDASLDDDSDRVTRYYASKSPSNASFGSFSEYRTHVLEPPKMNIVIGNLESKS